MATVAQTEAIIKQARKVYDQYKHSIDADVRQKAADLNDQCDVLRIHLDVLSKAPASEREDRLAAIDTEIFKIRQVNSDLSQTVRTKQAQGIDISSTEVEVYIEGRTRTMAGSRETAIRPLTVDNAQQGEINRAAIANKLGKKLAAATPPTTTTASSDAAKTSRADYAAAVVTHQHQVDAEKKWVRTNPSATTIKVGGK